MRNLFFLIIASLLFISCNNKKVDYEDEILNKKWRVGQSNGNYIHTYLDSSNSIRYNYKPETKDGKIPSPISTPSKNQFDGEEGWDQSLYYNRFKIFGDSLVLYSSTNTDTTNFKINSINDNELELTSLDGLHKGDKDVWYGGHYDK